MQTPRVTVLLPALAAAAFMGCGGTEGNLGQTKLPPAIVTAGVPLEKSIADYVEYTGRIDAVESVEIRARVTGFLTNVLFISKEGLEVEQGTPLYQIDDREFKADLLAAESELSIARAQQEKADSDLKRSVLLKQRGSISDEELEHSQTAKKQADANVESAQAKRDRAQLNVEFSSIAAPISGRISRTEIDAGNIVKADTTPLTTIVSVDPVNVNFDLDERMLLTIRRLIREGKLSGGGTGDAGERDRYPMELGLVTDQGYPKRGYLDFVDNRINPATGTIRVRGVFPNPASPRENREMSPGMFARVRVPLSEPRPVLLVAERSIGTDQGRKFVYLVNDKNEVVDRTVTLGASHEGLRVISEGLAATDRVIIDGVQRVRPGSEVEVKPAAMDSRPGAAATAGQP